MRQRDIRTQRQARESERWQQERDDEADESRDVPDQDDEPPSRESMT